MLLPGHELELPLFASFTGAYRNLFSRSHFLSSVLNCLDDIHIAGAAAQVARDAHADLVLGRVGIAPQKSQAGHHHPWSAVSTLQPVLLVKSLLQWMQFAALFQALNGHD